MDPHPWQTYHKTDFTLAAWWTRVAHMPFVKLFQLPELEEHFIVVQWDQRGAGKSYSNHLTETDMHLENFVQDAKELTDLLCARFHQDKIFLLDIPGKRIRSYGDQTLS